MKTYEKHYDNYYFDTEAWNYVSIEQLRHDWNYAFEHDDLHETFDDFMNDALSKNGSLETVEYAYKWAKDEVDFFLANLKEDGLTLETCDKWEKEEYEIYAEKLAEAVKYMNMK